MLRCRGYSSLAPMRGAAADVEMCLLAAAESKATPRRCTRTARRRQRPPAGRGGWPSRRDERRCNRFARVLRRWRSILRHLALPLLSLLPAVATPLCAAPRNIVLQTLLWRNEFVRAIAFGANYGARG